MKLNHGQLSELSIPPILTRLPCQANSVASYVSDMAWAYAMLLTTPLIVTVGLSMTIPLSLVGEMVQYAQYSSVVYWIGAAVVVLSFVIVSHDGQDSEKAVLGMDEAQN